MAYCARSPGSTAATASLMLAVFIVAKKLYVESLSSSHTPAHSRLNFDTIQKERGTELCNSTQQGEQRQRGSGKKKMGQCAILIKAIANPKNLESNCKPKKLGKQLQTQKTWKAIANPKNLESNSPRPIIRSSSGMRCKIWNVTDQHVVSE
jgi:hypothetical protein